MAKRTRKPEQLGSIDRFKRMLDARIDYLMLIRRLRGKSTCNAGSVKAFCFAVANHAGDERNQCTVSQETMQRETGLEATTQYRVAKVLEECGLIVCDRRSTRAKKFEEERRTNIYRPDWEKFQALGRLSVRDVIAVAVKLGKVDQLPKDLQKEHDEDQRASCNLQGALAVEQIADCKVPEQSTLQTARCSPCNLQDGHLADCKPNIQTELRSRTTQHVAAGAAVGDLQSEGRVCVSGEATGGTKGTEERRADLAAQARVARNMQRAEQALRDAGVWTKSIAKLIAAAAKAHGGDPLGRIEAVIAAANDQGDRKRRLNHDFNAAAWIARAIEENWDLTTTSRRTA